MRLSALFDEFARYLRVEKEATAPTIATYRFGFHDFIEFARQDVGGSVLMTHFTHERCRDYQYALANRNLQPNTIRLRLAILSSFARWAVRNQRIDRNPLDRLTRPRRRTRLPHVPRFTVIEDWLNNGLDLRSKAMIALMSYGGLRRSEVVALNVGDYDPRFGLRRVRGKGGDEAGVALPETARNIIDAYLAAQGAGARPEAPMFVVRYRTVGGKSVERRMHSNRVQKIVKRIGATQGLPGLHPHAFRHACGAELLSRSRNLRAVQEHLRHADIQTTTIYTRLTQPEMQQIVRVFDQPSGVSAPSPGD